MSQLRVVGNPPQSSHSKEERRLRPTDRAFQAYKIYANGLGQEFFVKISRLNPGRGEETVPLVAGKPPKKMVKYLFEIKQLSESRAITRWEAEVREMGKALVIKSSPESSERVMSIDSFGRVSWGEKERYWSRYPRGYGAMGVLLDSLIPLAQQNGCTTIYMEASNHEFATYLASLGFREIPDLRSNYMQLEVPAGASNP